MYQRPKFGESDEDLLKLQEEFNKHKAKSDFKLASTVVSSESKDDATSSSIDNDQMQVQEHLDNTFEDIPKLINIGSIIEKKSSNTMSQFKCSRSGFPQAKRRDLSVSTGQGRSIFSQQIKKFKSNNEPGQSDTMDTTNLVIKENVKYKPVTPSSSIRSMPNSVMNNIKGEIHMENLDRMNSMTPDEILEEREKLMSTLDPAIIAFLKSKRLHNQPKVETRQPSIAQQNKPVEGLNVEEIECARDILSQPDAEKWIHFDALESNKLAWMKDVKKPDELPKDEKYEARFDFAGWLLPYAQEEINDENRILYHHGEEPGRPGYTLQELFQLCRSNVMQQKIVSLNTIAAILNLYTSGIYDHIIDIPIEQVFFVLRFCLDENAPATLNSSIKAIRNLFCSQIDETCLDCLLGFGLMPIQAILAVDEDADDNTVNDQQLAESNLVKCLVRSGIFIRIRYILTVVKPTEIETIVHCLDILTRLARDSDFVVEQLWQFEGLIDGVIGYFVPKVLVVKSTSGYETPIVQAIKLLRILSSRNENIAKELVNKYKVLESLATYLANEQLSLNTTGLKLQIESLQLWETLAHYKLGIDDFKGLRPVLLKLLDYHLKNTNVDASWTIQTHTGALLSLLAQVARHDYQCVLEYVKMIFENGLPKWTTQFSHISVYSCGKLQLITSLFNLLSTIYKYQLENVHLPWENVYKLIEVMISSEAFRMVTANIQSSSNILNNYDVHKSSPNLLFSGCAVWDTADHIVPVLQTKSAIPFLNMVTQFVNATNSNKLKLMLLNHENITTYLKTIQMSHNFYMTSNWYTKIESSMILNLLNISVQLQREVDTSLFYEVAVKSLCIYTAEQKQHVELLFKSIIFCPTFYPSEVLLKNLNLKDDNNLLKSSLEEMYNIQKVYVDVLGLQQNLPNLTTKRALSVTSENIMPLDWVYSPIIALYSHAEPSKVAESSQNFIISNCLRWVHIYETYFPDLSNMINATDKFCRLTCTFLGSDNLFLIPEIQLLLTTCLRQILVKHEPELDFDKAIHGLKSFQDLYTQLLEQYQGVSYGDKLFGQFLLVPLAQRHNVKFRKAIWSEYAGIIQIFNVTENDLIVDVNKYLEPLETDMSLLKCYHKTISCRAIRPSSIFYKIAKHHVDAFKNKKKDMEIK